MIRNLVVDFVPAEGGGGTWGSITGTLADQTDLQAELDASGGGAFTEDANGQLTIATNANLDAASGVETKLDLSFEVNQSGSAGYTAFGYNITETATGTGVKNLVDLKVDGSSKFSVRNTGRAFAAAESGGGYFFEGTTSGFVSQSGSNVDNYLNGVKCFVFRPTMIASVGGAGLLNESPSATNPVLTPLFTDADTGLGWAGADQLSLIAGGVEGIRVAESGGAITTTMTDNVMMPDLPTSDPTNAGQLWSNSGVLTVSAG